MLFIIGLLESLKIPSVVAINKVDLLENQNVGIPELTKECLEYEALKSSAVVPVSAETLYNMDVLIETLAKLAQQQVAMKRMKNTELTSGNFVSSHDKDDELLTGRGFVLNMCHEFGASKSISMIVLDGQVHLFIFTNISFV